MLPAHPAVTTPGRAVTNPVPLTASADPSVAGLSPLFLCIGNKARLPGEHEPMAGTAVTEGTLRSSLWPLPTVTGTGTRWG